MKTEVNRNDRSLAYTVLVRFRDHIKFIRNIAEIGHVENCNMDADTTVQAH